MRKALKTLVVLLTLVLAATMTVACKKKSGAGSGDINKDEHRQIETITFGDKTVEFIIGEEKYLLANYQYNENIPVVYSSSDERIAAVEHSTGKVTAISVGEAKIIATMGESVAQCNIEVGLGEYVPTLNIENVAAVSANVEKTSSLDLSCSVFYNNKTYRDMNLSFELSDDSVGDVKDNKFLPKKLGKVDVTIKADWRNVTNALLEKTVTITVIPDIELYVNSGETHYSMHNKAQVGEARYSDTEIDFIVTAKENDIDKAFNVNITSGEDIVAYNANTNKLKVLDEKTGNAVIEISFTDETGTVQKIAVTVSVYESAPDNSGYFNPDWVGTSQASVSRRSEIGNFVMSDGAEIFVNDLDQGGIRWTVNVSEEYHQYLLSLGRVEYHTIVDDKPIAAAGESNTAVDVLCADTPKFTNGVWKYSTSIIYDNLTEIFGGSGLSADAVKEKLASAYRAQLQARAYVIVRNVYGQSQIEYSTVGDTQRSIKGLALNDVLTEKVRPGDDNYDKVAAYIGDSFKVDTTTEKAYNTGITNMYSEADGSGSVTLESVPNGNYEVYVNGKELKTVTLADGSRTVTLENLSGLSDMAGKDVYADFVNDSGKIFRVPFRYATKVIDSVEDVVAFRVNAQNKAFGGYYLLKSDIDGSTQSLYSHGTATVLKDYVCGLTGTFDGNGYSLKNFTVQGGIFGMINGGTVKNLAVSDIDCKYVNVWGAYILAQHIKGGVIDNCYFHCSDLAVNDSKRTGGFASYIDKNTKISNTVIALQYYFGSAEPSEQNYGLISGGHDKSYANKADFVEWNMEGVIVVIANAKTTKLVNGTDIAIYAQNQQAVYDADTSSQNKEIVSGVCFYQTNGDITLDGNNLCYSTEDHKDDFTANYDSNLWDFHKNSAGIHQYRPTWKSRPIKA